MTVVSKFYGASVSLSTLVVSSSINQRAVVVLHYIESTQDTQDSHTGALFDIAASHEQMEQYEQARSLLGKLLQVERDNEAARALLLQLPMLSLTSIVIFRQ
ncbi:hypothetical protein ACO0K9_26595 [Undibacterium sp. Ji50W]|uniref:hypothetical protein n=1 Tax=Undibacterium sp. Ji50W TaxID=3413041 RepID=UPI003BF221E9